jgi:hypothetical protein
MTGICTVVTAIGFIEINPKMENEKTRSREMQKMSIFILLAGL